MGAMRCSVGCCLLLQSRDYQTEEEKRIEIGRCRKLLVVSEAGSTQWSEVKRCRGSKRRLGHCVSHDETSANNDQNDMIQPSNAESAALTLVFLVFVRFALSPCALVFHCRGLGSCC